MAASNSLKRLPGESELGFLQRVGNLKQSGIINMTWQELADVFNRELRDNGEKYNESTYRKKYAFLREVGEEFGNKVNDNNAEELKELRRELEKEKVKVRDERNEYRKLIREEARKESYLEQFIRSIEEAVGQHALEYDGFKRGEIIRGNTTLFVPLTDIHAGIEIDNHWTKFNSDILKNMLNKYLDKVFEIAIRQGSEEVVVLASELISGLIHTTLRIQNNQDLIDQFLTVMDYLCDFLVELSKFFNKVTFCVAPGNHSRINAKREDSLAHENMDNLIIPFVSARLQNYPSINYVKNEIDQSVAVVNERGKSVAFVHGDKDTMANATKNMERMLGYMPDIIVLGHRHFNSYVSEGKTRIIQSGSFMGVDEYSVNNRLIGQPEQTVFVLSDNGLECVYDVRL